MSSGESPDNGKEGKDVLKDICKDIEELPPSKPEVREADHRSDVFSILQ